MASSTESPSDMQPGRSGNSIKNPPPSSSVSSRMVNGYSGIFIIHLQTFNKSNKFFDINWFYGAVSWNTKQLNPLIVIKYHMTTTSFPNCHAILFGNSFQMFNTPIL